MSKPDVAASPIRIGGRRLAAGHIAVIAGLAAIIVPTLGAIATRFWSTSEGTQGPIILATGLWLLWRERVALRRAAAPIAGLAGALILVPFVLLYAFGRGYGILSVETGCAYAIFLLVALLQLGPRAMRRAWFPFAYLAFLIVPPATLVGRLTQPLRLWVSGISVDLLHAAGLPVAVAGATIQIGQYELLVKTACAGLGSMFTLCAVGMFYVYLRRQAGPAYAAVLLAAVVPVAIAANIVRVVLLVLGTWYAGAAVAESAAHEAAGLVMFCVAMAGMFAIDGAAGALAERRERRDG